MTLSYIYLINTPCHDPNIYISYQHTLSSSSSSSSQGTLSSIHFLNTLSTPSSLRLAPPAGHDCEGESDAVEGERRWQWVPTHVSEGDRRGEDQAQSDGPIRERDDAQGRRLGLAPTLPIPFLPVPALLPLFVPSFLLFCSLLSLTQIITPPSLSLPPPPPYTSPANSPTALTLSLSLSSIARQTT